MVYDEFEDEFDFSELDAAEYQPRYLVMGTSYDSDGAEVGYSNLIGSYNSEAAAINMIDELYDSDPEELKDNYLIPNEAKEFELRGVKSTQDDLDDPEIFSIRTIYFN